MSTEAIYCSSWTSTIKKALGEINDLISLIIAVLCLMQFELRSLISRVYS